MQRASMIWTLLILGTFSAGWGVLSILYNSSAPLTPVHGWEAGACTDGARSPATDASLTGVRSPFPSPATRRPFVFVYDLPCKWNTCSKPGGFKNNGYGSAVPGRLGVYTTDAWELEAMVHARLLRSGHRTLDPLEADLFYIPYYITPLTLRPGGMGKVMSDVQALEYVRDRYESWNRTRGERHFVTVGRVWGGVAMRNEFNRSPLSHKVVFLPLETVSWSGRKPASNITHVMAVPYPSVYHYSAEMGVPTRFPWSPPAAGEPPRRRWLVANVAGARTDLRKALARQCESAPDLCTAGRPHREGAPQEGDVLSHSEGLASYSVYMESTFCMQTPGDTTTRKGLFDSIAVGCIPVLFHPWTAEKQYPLHLPDISNYTVYIPQDHVVKGKMNVIEYLSAIPDSEIARMRASLSLVAFRTQYAIDDPPPELGPDALELILDAVWAMAKGEPIPIPPLNLTK